MRTETKTRSTLKTVADLAGVSMMTVSRVVNESPQVAEETRDRVRKAMKDAGYEIPRVEQRFRSPLRRKQRIRTGNLCLFFPDSNPDAMRTALSLELIQGVEEAVSAAGLNLMVSYLRNPGEVPNFLRHRSVDGVIVRGGEGIPPALSRGLAKLPCVYTFGHPVTLDGHGDFVQPDNEAVGMAAALLAHNKGCKHCALVNFSSTHSSFEVRRDSYLRMAKRLNLSVKLLETEPSQGPKLLRRLAKELGKFDSCFVPGTTSEVGQTGLMDAFRDMGFTVPKGKYPVLTLYVDSALKGDAADLVLLDLLPQEIGRQAVAQLMRRIESPDAPRCRLLIEPKFYQTGAR